MLMCANSNIANEIVECSEGGQVSTASDVFSFGVVLLELFIWRRPIDDMFKDGLSIAKYVEMNFPDRILEIVDPQVQHELDLCQETPMAVKEKGIHCLCSVLNIGLCCTNPTPIQIMCTSLYGNETDRLSLLEFKKAISLDPQQALMSWNDSTYFFSWEGVLCRVKTPHRLISLNLTNQGLVGQISPSLGNLTFLKFLFLDTNSFTGEIPLSLGHLHHLRTIYLSNNTLEGAIPDFTNCSSLKALRLNGNHLVGQLINNFPPKLQVLTLASNNFTGTIPSSFANITELRNLNFASNNIKGNIPNEFSNFLMMEILILGGNMLTGRFPQAILNISTLIDLFLNFNHLSGEVPSNILYSLPNLQVLALDFNFLQGHIPSSLVNASNLRVLDISSNNFTGVVPSSIGKLSKLYWLSLEGNQLQIHKKEDWEFMNSLANCTRLQIFSMAYNRLEGHLPSSLSNFSTHLPRLHLDGNAISGFLPSGIEHLSNLIDLSLGTNDFTGTLPEWLGNLKQLQMLGLYENYFIGFIPSSLSNLSQLVYLGLHFNKFDGHIPSLGNLQMLEVLNISNNNLHCIIPTEIFSIMSIVQIDLSFNNLHGKFPTDIGNAKQLISLELSSNKLSGDIPNALGNCESLEYIMLASLSNLQYLEQLDLSFNHLNGEVPVEGIFKNATAFQMDGNQGLCGGLPELHLPACPTVLLVTSKNKNSVILKLVIPLACMVSLALALSIYFIGRGKQKKKSISFPSLCRKFPKVSFNDLSNATDRFSTANLIGRGRFGSVYQAKLFQDNIVVAVKVFNLETSGSQESFIAECNALRNLRHRNLVPIFTLCGSIDAEGNDFKALVYELMPRGDLHKLLYSTGDDGDASNLNHITLAQRISIIVDLSNALEYLHHNNQGTIIHCDLKPSNILLDDNMIAHVGDFGLVKFRTDSSTSFGDSNSIFSLAIKGTIGYIAPECAEGDQVSTASDVYSFGVVLLELFICRRPIDAMFKDGLSIAKFTEINFPDRILEIIDPQLQQELDLCLEAPVEVKEKDHYNWTVSFGDYG
uniref:Receptor kinase-like protein Xa21 n=1 Tax=Oryza nivara TaxID=4536 RepID=A0A0E0HGN9_ORYNI